MKWVTFSMLAAAAAAALSGCSDKFDGSYEGWPGVLQTAVVQVDGNKAVFEIFNNDGKTQMGLVRREMTAYRRNGMLHLARYDGVVFVYGLDADDMSLDCLSDSCLGEERGMPSSWKPVKQ
jgi:hypothetical protein